MNKYCNYCTPDLGVNNNKYFINVLIIFLYRHATADMAMHTFWNA